MKLMLKLVVCLGLIQGCGSAKMEANRKNPEVPETHPDALSDDQIAQMEKEAVRLEKALNDLADTTDRYGSASCQALDVPSEDLSKASGKEPCSKTCALVQDINAAIKAGDCARAKELIKELKKVTRTEQTESESKLKKCKERIKKAKDCRGKNKDGGKGGSDKDDDTDAGKDNPGPGADTGTEPSTGKTEPNDSTGTSGKGKA